MTSKADAAFRLAQTSHRPPIDYDRPPAYDKMVAEKDVYVAMRDGVKICADIYRPDTTEKLPALLAISIHNKDLQGPEMAETGLRFFDHSFDLFGIQIVLDNLPQCLGMHLHR
jgi:predicted acyl esterase